MAHIELDGIVGKPLAAYKDGKRREVGTITHATAHKGGIDIKATITDEALEARLGKLERASMKIGG